MDISPVALYGAACSDLCRYADLEFSLDHRSDISVRSFASSYQLSSIIRKWIPKETDIADKVALEAFTSANGRCARWKLSSCLWLKDEQILGEIRKILDNFFHPEGQPLISSYFDLLSFGRPGPGVNVGSLGTSLYTKYFSSPLTSTSEYLYEEYKRFCEWIPFLSDAECLRYEKFGLPSVTSSSRCSFVPKTNATSRMICVEPSLNMFYQLGLAFHLEKRLQESFGICLGTQPKVNHRLARVGSINGSFCTIDLSSASDSISLGLCEYLLPKWFFELLLTLRSPSTLIGGKRVPLFMVSTMGNGFTFPLQTIIFAAIVQAVNTCKGIPNNSDSYSVFGDDIICRKESFDQIVSTLQLLGFSVNLNKTFSKGSFRESCGADWFHGQPVRPVFIRKLDTPFDIMVAINQLNEWSTYTGIPMRYTVLYLYGFLGRKFRTFVPFDSQMDSGIRVPLAFIDPRYDSNQSFLFKSWERRASSLKVFEGSIRTPNGFRGTLLFNPAGLYCSFLFGELASGSIMVRHDLKRFRSRLRCSPNWNYIPSRSETNGVKLRWQQWETAVSINLDKP